MARDKLKALPKGAQIGKFGIDKVLAESGFGLTYLAKPAKPTESPVVVKEFMPAQWAGRRRDRLTVRIRQAKLEVGFNAALETFAKVGRTLARFRHANVAPVLRNVHANGTVYRLSEYQDREHLGEMLARCERDSGWLLQDSDIKTFLWPLLTAVDELHKAGIIHRSIKPTSICVRQDGSPVLFGFGSAGLAWEPDAARVPATLAEGFAAPESYQSDGNEGPWTDVYGLAAVLYRVVSGARPPDARERDEARRMRLPDPLVPAVTAAAGRYPRSLLEGIDRGLELRGFARPQSINEWRALLEHGAPPKVLGLDPETGERVGASRINTVAAGLTLTLLLFAGTVMAFRLFPDSADLTPNAAAQAQVSSAAAAEVERVAREQAAALAQSKRRAEQAERQSRERQRREAEAIRAMIAEASRKSAAEDEARRKARPARQTEENRPGTTAINQFRPLPETPATGQPPAVAMPEPTSQQSAMAEAIDLAKLPSEAPAGLKKLVAGSTIQFQRSGGSPGKSFLLRFGPGGALSGTFDGGVGQENDIGTWRVAGDKLCIQWHRWDFGEERCYGIVGEGTRYRAVGARGTLSGPFMIVR